MVGLGGGQPSLAVPVPRRASTTQAAPLEERVKRMKMEDNYRQFKVEIQAH